MNSKDERIIQVEFEISSCQNKLNNMKKRIPWAILMGVLFALLFPFLPGSRGSRPIIENWEYHHALLFCAIIFVVVYPIAYTIGKTKLEKKLKELKLKKHLIEKEN